jgi:hypothetical protein
MIDGQKWFAGNITMMQEKGIIIDTKQIQTLTKE